MKEEKRREGEETRRKERKKDGLSLHKHLNRVEGNPSQRHVGAN